MSNDINFSDLWRQQSAPAPSIDELLGKAKELKNRERFKLIGLVLLMLATAGFIVWIKIHFQSSIITTLLGVVLVLVAIIMFVITSFGTLGLLMRKHSDTSVSEQLKQLIGFQKKQEFMQRVIMSLYFILLSAGIFLYMIEYTIQMKIWAGILAYTVVAVWIAFNWFYMRPRMIRKQRVKLEGIIEEFQRIQKQVEETK
ncbi:MAG TPA: hypothetical protein VGF30_03315 [Bacteroidia bacterium]